MILVVDALGFALDGTARLIANATIDRAAIGGPRAAQFHAWRAGRTPFR
ncbi:hypothetical protein MYA_5009 [Burkholderia sp. KJ006]|nr:hypothetical protein MYA_5009 [Burkholderia sp. KJ006]